MNWNVYKSKILNKPKNNVEKPSYNTYLSEKTLKNVDNNTIYASSNAENNSENEIKNNELSYIKKN